MLSMKTKLFATIGVLILSLVVVVGFKIGDLYINYSTYNVLKNEFEVLKLIGNLSEKVQFEREIAINYFYDHNLKEKFEAQHNEFLKQLNLVKELSKKENSQLLKQKDLEDLTDKVTNAFDEVSSIDDTSSQSVLYTYGEINKLLNQKLELFSAMVKETSLFENANVMFDISQALGAIEFLKLKILTIQKDQTSLSQLDLGMLWENKFKFIFNLDQYSLRSNYSDKKIFEMRQKSIQQMTSPEWSVISDTLDYIEQNSSSEKFDIDLLKLQSTSTLLIQQFATHMQMEKSEFDRLFQQFSFNVKKELILWSLMLIFLVLAMTANSFIIVNKVSTQIIRISKDLNYKSTKVKETSESLFDNSIKLSESAVKQSNVVQETSASITEITSLLASTSSFSDQANQLTAQVKTEADSGMNQMKKLMDSMNNVAKSNQEMAKIRDLIKEIYHKTQAINDIVFKTQILSFNASIEAARAGENGRGFAVVADEVGQLATLSGRISKEIEELVKSGEEKVESVVHKNGESVTESLDLATDVYNFINEINAQLDQVSNNTQQIHSYSLEQEIGVNQINSVMKHVDEAALISQKNCEELNTSSMMLKSYAEELMMVSNLAKEIAFGKKFSEEKNENLVQHEALHKKSQEVSFKKAS